jgi:hypothetical protein
MGGTGMGGTGMGGTGMGGTGIVAMPPFDVPTLSALLPGATAIVSSSDRDLIYVAVGSNAFGYNDSIVVLDPVEARVIADVPVGPNPDRLAISDDGTTLWVGIHDRSSVLQLDIQTNVPLPLSEFVLPPGDYAPVTAAAGPMVLLPGTTDSLAVSLHVDGYSPSLAGVVLLDEGIPRPTGLPSHTGASRLTRGPSGHLLGYNNLHTGFGLYVIDITPDGLTQTEYSNLVSGFETDITYADGFLFSTSGDVVNVQDPDFPYYVGRFPYAGPILPDVPAGIAWMLGRTGSSYYGYDAELSLVLLDVLTLQPLGSVAIDNQVRLARNLIRSKSGVLAFIAQDATVSTIGLYLLR